MLDYLPKHHPDLYQRNNDEIKIRPIGQSYRISDYEEQPLLLAGKLVQDDLCLIRVGEDGPVLVAANLCFPSSWALADKIGKHLDAVHAPVPGYQADLASKVNRMMAMLPDDRIIWRMNWSLDEGPDLHRPVPHAHDQWLAAKGDPMAHIFIRVERQTFRRLPKTGDILFTIRIYTDALTSLQNHTQAPQLATSLAQQLRAFTQEEVVYKGLASAKPTILAALSRIESRV